MSSVFVVTKTWGTGQGEVSTGREPRDQGSLRTGDVPVRDRQGV